jgi:ribosomal protein S27E
VDCLETTREKIAYLKGIVDGDPSLKEDRIRFLFGKVLEILEEITADINDLAKAQDDLDDYLQELDYDLAYLEDSLDDEEDDWGEWEDEPGTFLEVTCPDCGYPVSFEEEFVFDSGVQICCPRCDAVFFQSEDFEDLEELDDLPQLDGSEDD